MSTYTSGFTPDEEDIAEAMMAIGDGRPLPRGRTGWPDINWFLVLNFVYSVVVSVTLGVVIRHFLIKYW